jgi:hypothetical protein
MGNFTLQIADGADDARSAGAAWPGGSIFDAMDTSHRVGYLDPYFHMVGLRFPSVPIPAGDIQILSAVLRVRAAVFAYSYPAWRIYAEDVDDAAVMSAGHTPHDAWLAKTDAYNGYGSGNYIGWFVGTWYDLACKAALQEVVDRPGWAENNAVLFTVTPQNSDDPGHEMSTYDADPSYAAQLIVTYDVRQHWVAVMNDDPGGI